MASEREALLWFLDTQRTGVLRILDGLSEEGLRSPLLPSAWTCLGLVQHLTLNERYWFRWAVGGEEIPGTQIVDGRCQVVLDDMPDPDNEWQVAPHLSADMVRTRYRDETNEANAAIAGARLDDPPRNHDDWWAAMFGEGTVNVRWIILHMIEETAQHAGHLDIVRELLDAQRAGNPQAV
jgi:Protein of unknown function (DUF664)